MEPNAKHVDGIHPGPASNRQAGRQVRETGGRSLWEKRRGKAALPYNFLATPEHAQGDGKCPLWEIEMAVSSSKGPRRGDMLLHASLNLVKHVKPMGGSH